MFRPFILGAALAAVAAPAFAEMRVEDAYARSANPKTGAAFMVLVNEGDSDDVLVEARGDVARKIELHTHIIEDGVARMREVEDGIPVRARERVTLQRGGLHVMMMGIGTPLQNGGHVPLTLVFRSGQEIVIDVPVDNDRRPDQAAGQAMQGMNHGAMDGHGMQHGKAPAN